jgi:hypothetical protein
MNRAGDFFDEVAMGDVGVGEFRRRKTGRRKTRDFEEATVGRRVLVLCLVLDGGAILKLPTGVAADVVPAAVEDTGELIGAVAV